MGENTEINREYAIWFINMFCVVPCMLTCTNMVISLFSLIELNLCGTHKQFDSLKIILKSCTDSHRNELISFVSILSRTRNSVAHCNDSIVTRLEALQTITRAMNESTFLSLLHVTE